MSKELVLGFGTFWGVYFFVPKELVLVLFKPVIEHLGELIKALLLFSFKILFAIMKLSIHIIDKYTIL